MPAQSPNRVNPTLIGEIRKDNPNVEMSILRSSENVNCDMVLAYQINGEKHSFMEEFK